MNTTAIAITASEKQVSFIVKLMGERDYSGLNVTNVEDRVQSGPLSKTDASTLISLMLGCPKKATAKVEVAEGFYYFEGDIYRVVKSKSSDRRYAKVMTIPEDGSKGRWEYAPNKISVLVGAEKLDMQVATSLGRETGICMICGSLLTDPESIARGIGPICSAKL